MSALARIRVDVTPLLVTSCVLILAFLVCLDTLARAGLINPRPVVVDLDFVLAGCLFFLLVALAGADPILLDHLALPSSIVGARSSCVALALAVVIVLAVLAVSFIWGADLSGIRADTLAGPVELASFWSLVIVVTRSAPPVTDAGALVVLVTVAVIVFIRAAQRLAGSSLGHTLAVAFVSNDAVTLFYKSTCPVFTFFAEVDAPLSPAIVPNIAWIAGITVHALGLFGHAARALAPLAVAALRALAPLVGYALAVLVAAVFATLTVLFTSVVATLVYAVLNASPLAALALAALLLAVLARIALAGWAPELLRSVVGLAPVTVFLPLGEAPLLELAPLLIFPAALGRVFHAPLTLRASGAPCLPLALAPPFGQLSVGLPAKPFVTVFLSVVLEASSVALPAVLSPSGKASVLLLAPLVVADILAPLLRVLDEQTAGALVFHTASLWMYGGDGVAPVHLLALALLLALGLVACLCLTFGRGAIAATIAVLAFVLESPVASLVSLAPVQPPTGAIDLRVILLENAVTILPAPF